MRLAYEQGLLKQKNLSYFQHWALLYWIYMDRRVTQEDAQDMLIQQTFNLFPERWEQLYREDMLKRWGLDVPDELEGYADVELEDMDRFLANMEQKRWINADALGLPPDWKPDVQGTRV